MSRESPEDEWELSKENVQPLRQGRKLSSLNAGLKPLSGDQLSRIREEKHIFEGEIRTYSGEDPLSIWYKYIQWAEQTFPKGGKDSNLTTILQRCVTQFKDDEKYRNDERYIHAWIKLAGMFTDPLEIYNFLYDQNIGCELACFYDSWASLLEQLGNTKKADAIFLEGLNKNARPYESLKRKHEEFQKRVARRMADGDDSVAMEDVVSEEDSSRQVLSQLRTSGRQAPVVRTGISIKGGAGVLTGARPKSQPQVQAPVSIFCDENQEPSALQSKTGEYKTAPKKDAINKENVKAAGVWTKQKISKPSVNVPISAVSSHKQPSFAVHVDADADTSIRTPAKLPPGSLVLSSKKMPKTTCDIKSMALPPFPQNPGERPMYCKDKIYTGTEEFSFEEIRAFRWTKLQEKLKREEEEKRCLEESRKKFAAERQYLEDQTERLRQQRLQLEQEQQRMFEEARQQMQAQIQAHMQQLETQRLLETEKQKQALERGIEARLQEMSVTESRIMERQHNSIQQTSFNNDSYSQAQPSGEVGSRVTNQSLNTSTRTTPSSFNTSRSHHSGESFDRTMSGAPSPTVNTKEALRLVRGMFNTSLETDKPVQAVENISMHEPVPIRPPQSVSKAPFPIFDENQGAPISNAGPITVFEDRENLLLQPKAPATTSVRRGLGSTLQARPGIVEPYRDPEPMEESARTTNPPLFDDKTEKIESHARDDITLAPVGSHLSFAAAAKLSSTPFHSEQSAARGGGSSRLNISDIEMQSPLAKKGKTAPFEIYNENQPASVQQPRGFTVFEDKYDPIPAPKASVSVRRGLGSSLQTQSGHVEPYRGPEHVEESARATNPPLFDDKTEKIESHARDDITLAPVGSHLSFAAAAKLSSTPFHSEQSTARGGGTAGKLNISDIDMEEKAPEPPTSTAGTEDTQNQSSFSFRKDLSPIMEGSSEDSNKSSTLHHDTQAGSRPLMEPLTPIQDRSEDTHSLLAAAPAAIDDDDDDDMNRSEHVIDVTTYIPPETDDKTEHLLSMSVCIVDPKDPFDCELKAQLLSKLKKPLTNYESYNALNEYMPDMRKGSLLSLGLEMYTIQSKIAEGGFAKVYLVEQDDMDFDALTLIRDEMPQQKLAIKVEKPAQQWEFYICTALHERLTKLNNPVDVRPSMMKVKQGYFFTNGSCLVTDYMPYGTLLDLVNHVKTKLGQPLETLQSKLEPVMVYMTIELLHMVEKLHRCNIIHGDIKPDNFLVLQFSQLPESSDPAEVFGGRQRFVQLIDFGQSIDMTLYPSGTTFTSKVTTKCFQCIEMMTNQPWTYQTDLFGLAGTIHVLVFGEYMKVYQTCGEWRMSSKIFRNWNANLWKKLFHTLLNVPSCDEIPDLSVLRKEFEEYFVSELLEKYNQQYTKFHQIINTYRRKDYS